MTDQTSSYLSLTRQQRAYVDGRLQGLTQVAAATAAGYSSPRVDGSRTEKDPNVQAALIERMQKTADEVDFGRKEAHDMLMEAFQNAETASEQVMATNALIKLHGLEAPKKVEVEHTHNVSGELRYLPTEELMKLANMEETLTLEGEFAEIGEKPELAPPIPDEENSEDGQALPSLSEDYGT